MSTLGKVAPGLGEGDTIVAILLSSVALWGFFFFISRGVQEATAVNRIVTIAKMVPIAVFIILALFYLKPDVFVENFSGTGEGSLFTQVRNTMLVTVFVFLGVEGASVYSRHARKREDVGRATVLGFLSVFAIFASVTIVSYGLMPLDEIAQLRQPSMAGILESAVGTWGKVFVSVGLIVSVLGAYLAWTLMAAEVLFVAAKDEDMPRFLRRTNDRDVPMPALIMTTALIQLFLIATYFSEDAFNFALDLTSSLTLIPFLLAAAYAVRLVLTRETYKPITVGSGSGTGSQQRAGRASDDRVNVAKGWTTDLVVSILATLYTVFLLYAAGPKFVLVSFIIYAPATLLFVRARREQNRQLFSGRELVILAVSAAGAVTGVLALALGWIQL